MAWSLLRDHDIPEKKEGWLSWHMRSVGSNFRLSLQFENVESRGYPPPSAPRDCVDIEGHEDSWGRVVSVP